MLIEELRAGKKVVGANQCTRAVRDGRARQVFLARDADERLTAPLEKQCRRQEIPVVTRYTMEELGRAAGIQVGAAVIALLKKTEQM